MRVGCASATRMETFLPTTFTPAIMPPYVGEGVDDASYMKAPYYKPTGFPQGCIA